MTISTTTIKNSYSGNSSTTEFSYTFKISDEDHIQVIIRTDATGVEVVQTKTTHYSVGGVGDAGGGTVTMVSAPATGETLVLRRSTTQTQGMDLIENDPLPADTLEDAIDKNLAISQELQEQIDRSFKVSRTNTITSSEFTDSADDRANKTLGFDGSGDLTVVADFNPAGGDSALFKFSTTTTDADPGASYVRFNHATIASATEIYIDDVDYDSTNVEAWVQSFDDVTGNTTNRGRIRIRKANDLSKWVTFKVNAAVTNASGYTKIPVAYIDGSGTLAADDKIWVSFVSSGEDGAIPGYYYKFDTGTSSTDPGAGELAFNNGTYSSVTAIYIDDVDQNSVTTSTDVLTWDDSTSTIKGYLHIVDINDPTTYARFSITGSSTDGSGFNTLVVTHLTSNNTFSAADELSVHFTRSGDTGDTGATGSTGSTGPAGPVSLSGSTNNTIVTVTGSNALAGEANLTFDGTNLLVASTGKVYLNDAGGEHISGSGTVLSIAGGAEIDLTATAIDINGTCDVSSTLTNASTAVNVAGKQTIWVPANAMTATTSNGCAAIAAVETTSGRPDMYVLDFDKDSDEHAQFTVAFPKSWNLLTVTFQVFWSGLAATTGVTWALQGVAMNDNETIDVAYGTPITVDDDAQSAVEELLVSAESSAVTIAGTPADDDLTYFRIFRDVSAGNDDMAGDARLHGVKIFYTTDAKNDA